MKYLEKAAVIEEPYRYSLSRIWDASRPLVLWIMLNPSTADADKDDATIRKIVTISDNNGYGGLYVGNMYAYRTKNPGELFKDEEINYEGEYTFLYLQEAACFCKSVIFACGTKAEKKRIAKIYNMIIIYIQEIYCLGYNKDGTPVHPLYQRNDSTFQVFDINRLEGKYE